MRVDWHGQSAFTLDGEAATVFIDPFGDMSAAASRGIEWGYPAIESPVGVDLLIVTHEHGDHNAVEVIDGEPALVRSVAGTHSGPLGDVVAIASEHDGAAGTERGPNTIVVFDLDGIRIAHFGDFGQPALRPEQRAHLDGIDLLFLPVGGGPTIDGATATDIALDLGAPWVVPMHYKTDKINFLDTEEAFVEAMPAAERLSASSFDTADLEKGSGPTAIVPAAP
ncbi:MAG TPA: MBL fold metallo-hydrolase [Solirubrobacterales bacterium]|jgi:L-ascorbate metabolism protein UlaG (beta-lactamase superfamily)|nr:MBL fold metallo-hydrolase [Solirubrobacterales bacterium]